MPRNKWNDIDWPEYQDHPSYSHESHTSHVSHDVEPDVSPEGTEARGRSDSSRHRRRSPWLWLMVGSIVAGLWLAGLLSTLPSVHKTTDRGKSLPHPRGAAPAGHTPISSTPQTPSALRTNLQPPNMVAKLSDSVVFILSAKFSGIGRTTSASIDMGTGFIISAQGHVVTNEHVISNRQQVEVVLPNGNTYDASVIAADAKLDLAVLKISATLSLRALPLGNSEQVQLGERVYVLGFPLGSKLGSTVTVSDGLISAIRMRHGEKWFQTSAPVNPGNSGGPLVQADTGVVVGILTSKVREAESIAFARPINDARAWLRRYVGNDAL